MQDHYFPTAHWQKANLLEMNISTKKLDALDDIIKSDYANICGLAVIKSGFMAYEKYFNGCTPDDAIHVASLTKSVLSALIGIAVDKGYIKSVNEKALSFFPEYALDTTDSVKEDIAIHHLLTMTAPYAFEDWHEPFEAMCACPDWIAYILDILGHSGSLGAFKYSSAGAHLLSAILTRATGQSAREFANEHLFAPLGMRQIANHEMKGYGFDDLFGKNVRGWVSDPAGSSAGGWGLCLTARDMARFGLLYLRGGRWKEIQVISKEWVDASTKANPNRYGYLWWLGEDDDYMALGDGGNVIYCIPSTNLVIAIASSFIPNASDRLFLIKEHILPAFIN